MTLPVSTQTAPSATVVNQLRAAYADGRMVDGDELLGELMRRQRALGAAEHQIEAALAVGPEPSRGWTA